MEIYGMLSRGHWGRGRVGHCGNQILKKTVDKFVGDRWITSVWFCSAVNSIFSARRPIGIPFVLGKKIQFVPNEYCAKVGFRALGDWAPGGEFIPPPPEV
jgi:hypothetical protein